jgi:hypothetical protein
LHFPTNDIFHQHHLVVTHGEHRAVQKLFRILLVSAGQEAKSLLETLRGAPQAVAVRIFADRLQYFAHMIGDG